MKFKKSLITAVTIILLMLTMVTPAGAYEVIDSYWQTPEERSILEKYSTSVGVARVLAEQDGYPWQMSGTGFFITKDIFVTNKHVAKSFLTDNFINQGYKVTGYEILLFLQGSNLTTTVKAPAKLIATSDKYDLAIFRISEIKIDGTSIYDYIEPLSLNDSSGGLNDKDVMIIGFPGSNDKPRYEVSQGKPESYSLENNGNIIYTAKIRPGFSGSPVIDKKTGKVIGVAAASVITEDDSIKLGLALAIPVDQLIEFLPKDVKDQIKKEQTPPVIKGITTEVVNKN